MGWGGLQEVFCFLFFWDSGLMGEGVWVGTFILFFMMGGLRGLGEGF